jgi:outer membrane receptor protein involved in Fe transport
MPRPSQLRTRLGTTAALAAALAATPAAAAIVEIPVQRLASALRDLALQTDSQIAYSPLLVRFRISRAVRGDYSVERALDMLLADSGLTWRRAAGGAILIERARFVPSPAPAPDAGPAASASDLLAEVVVTATRQSEVASRAPLSITAMNQAALDRQGVRTTADLARTAPSLTFRTGAGGDTAISIRGVTSTIGAATVGVYLDDTPIQKRLANGITSGNGNAYPQFFDLDRVEVLRGPQGTLYGSSSEGGTVRFITRQPSLTTMSGTAQAGLTSTEGGGMGHEAGAAVGGPIFPGRLGFRASVWTRRSGGYLDHVSIYDAREFGRDTNASRSAQLRLSLLWEPIPGLKITPTVHGSRETADDLDIFWEKTPRFQVNGGTFNNGPASLAAGLGALFPDFPDRVFVGYAEGPYDQFGPFKTPVGAYPTTATPQLQTSPRTTTLFSPSLSVEYTLGEVTAKSVTAYINDVNKGYVSSGGFSLRPAVLPTSITGSCGQGGQTLNYAGGCLPLTFPGFPQKTSRFAYRNARNGLTQELRFSSDSAARPISWVAGLFYSYSALNVKSDEYSNEEELTLRLRGIEEKYLLGNISTNGDIADREIKIREREAALYGELNYYPTQTLKVILGLRVSRNWLAYRQATRGIVFARPFDFVPTAAQPFPSDPRQITAGKVTETPITPRIGLAWQPDPDTLVYATTAKGYRTGGVNAPVNPTQCAAPVAAAGGQPPSAYASDSVWSYEAGVKARPRQGLRANLSVFYISWRRPQLGRQFPTCGYTYVDNAGAAFSRGVELETQARLGAGFTLSIAAAYTDARHRETVRAPGSAATIVQAGDPLGASKWQLSATLQYTTAVFGKEAYARADYRYASGYLRGPGPGNFGYDPIVAHGAPADVANLRAGIVLGRWEAAVFVNNVADSRDRLYVAHANASPLVTGSTFRPREVGVQIVHQY